MTKNDEKELHRLTNLLSRISDKPELSKDDKEALKKAALALSISFMGIEKKLKKFMTILMKNFQRSSNNTFGHWVLRLIHS